MPVGQMPVGEQQSLEQNTGQIQKGGPPWICGQHNVRASAEVNTGQNTDKGHTHPIPGQKLKFLTPPGIKPGPPGWKAGTLPTTSRRRYQTNFMWLNSFWQRYKITDTVNCPWNNIAKQRIIETEKNFLNFTTGSCELRFPFLPV